MVVVAWHLSDEDAGSQSQDPNCGRLAASSAVSAQLAQTKVAFDSGIRNQHFEPGDIIFEQGDLGDSVYVIVEGECEVLCKRKGQRELLAILSGGECFGEMALLSDRTRNATIRARTALNVLIIPKGDFDKLRQSVPLFGNVFSELAQRRAEAGSPHSSIDPGMPGGSIAIPTTKTELGLPPGSALSKEP